MTALLPSRMEEYTLTTVGINAPNTLEQIRWSSRTYRDVCSRFVPAWAAVNTEDFRDSALHDCDDATAEKLRHFLAQFGTRASVVTRDSVQEVLRNPDFAAQELRDQRLIEVDITASRPTFEKAFDQLLTAHGVGYTIAAKVLAALNPELFVMWDDCIFLAYYRLAEIDGGSAGATYVNFLLRMQRCAEAIALDAQENHSVADPAEHVCEKLGLQGPGRCILAKFIDEYNYLTITRCAVDPTN